MDEKLFRTAQMLGLRCTDRSGNERICACVECGKPGHLYWNLVKNVAFCHHCHASLKPLEIIEDLFMRLEANIEDHHLAELAKNRLLPVEAFADYRIVYRKGWFFIPVWDVNENFKSLRRYQPELGVRTCPGMTNELFGAERLGDAQRVNEPVYLCEGEWDAIALEWLRADTGQPGVVVGVPGASNFKREWSSWFKGRDVLLAFDHDAPGRDGMKRTAELLRHAARKIQMIQWEPDREIGFDIRDLITNHLKDEK